MATKEFITLDGLSRYHELISQVISDGDADSIKSLSVSGNTVNFYKNTTATGTPAYSVNMPDVSGFMDKISGATGGKIVTSTSAGQVSESATAIADLATNAFVGSLPQGAESTTVVDYISEAIEDAADDYMPKGESWEGDKVAMTNSDGTVNESDISIDDIVQYDESSTGYIAGIDVETTSVGSTGITTSDLQDSIAATAGFNGDSTIADAISALSDDVDDKMDKLTNPTGNYIVTSTSSGNVAESTVRFSDLASRQYVGELPESSQATTIVGYIGEVEDAADGKITKIASATGGKIATTTSGGEVAESGTAISDLATNAFVGSIPSGATATTVVGYVDEAVDDLENSLGTAAYADVATSAITEQSTDDSLVTAEQVSAFVAAEIAGLEGAMHFRGVITRQAGETDAQAIARVITSPAAGDVVVMSDNAKEYIYNNSTVGWREVGDETEFVKKTTTIAGVDLQDNITASELRTALNVADGAQVNVVETVKVNGSALTPDANKAVNVTVAEGATNGTVAVNGSDVAVHGLGSAAYTASTAYATSAQGALADTALQPSDIGEVSTSDIEALFS